MSAIELTPPLPARQGARGAVPCLATLAFFMSMDMALTVILIDPVRHSFGLSDLDVSLLQGTAYGLALGLSALPFGWLVDRRSRVTLLRLGLVGWIAAMAATGLARSFAAMLVARVALGMIAALMMPCAISLISDYTAPARRSIATSLFVVGQASGQALGIVAGGWAITGLAGVAALSGLEPWRLAYLAAAITAVLLVVPLALLREPPRREVKERSHHAAKLLRELRAIAAFVAPLLAALLLAQFTLQAATVWAAPLLSRRYGLAPGQFAGWLAADLMVGGIAGAVFGGWLGELGRRWFGRGGMLVPALVACGGVIPCSLFGLAPSVPLFALLLGLNILLNAIVATLGAISIGFFVPNELRGLVLGANSFLTALFSFATAPALVVVLSRAIGGEAMLGAAIAAASIPAAILAATCFALALRGRSVLAH